VVSSGRATKDGSGVYSVTLNECERAIIDVGHVVFFIQEVHRPKVVPVPWT
jgi:hypothetical protein